MANQTERRALDFAEQVAHKLQVEIAPALLKIARGDYPHTRSTRVLLEDQLDALDDLTEELARYTDKLP